MKLCVRVSTTTYSVSMAAVFPKNLISNEQFDNKMNNFLKSASMLDV